MSADHADDALPDFEDEAFQESGADKAGAAGAGKDDAKDAAKDGAAAKKGNYIGIHASGFRDFLLKPELQRAIVDCGFEHPSEVQHECIPQAVLGTDILCQAKSGMGKTAVFVLSTLQSLELEKKEDDSDNDEDDDAEDDEEVDEDMDEKKKKALEKKKAIAKKKKEAEKKKKAEEKNKAKLSCLVVCHTRELAFQIRREYDRFSKYFNGVKIGVVFGGIPIAKDIEMLSKSSTAPHVLIGTPGRVKALIAEKKGAKALMDMSNIKQFVLDECDKCLEKADMRKDVQGIFISCPKKKQVMMFSATMTSDIRTVCKKFMHEPHEIRVDEESKLTLHGLLQYYVKLDEAKKNRKLNDLLDILQFNQVIIFVKSVQRAVALDKLLTECSFPSITVHSALKQEERIARYKAFKEFQSRIMVATDLFGRGIDIEKVNVVINYDMPADSDSYLHRVGRAGRFGTKGLAISFVSSGAEEDSEVLKSVQSRFEVDISECPESIEPTSYLNA